VASQDIEAKGVGRGVGQISRPPEASRDAQQGLCVGDKCVCEPLAELVGALGAF